MKKIEAIVREGSLKDLSQINVPGMTVENVRGFGRQGGCLDVYERTACYGPDFRSKLKVTVCVPDDQVENTIRQIIATVREGRIGDGKIFVTDLADAIRIRTGERGDDALSGDDSEEVVYPYQPVSVLASAE